VPALKKQTYKKFELVIIPDKKFRRSNKGPAEKRNLGAKRARGGILAFIDDDAYPDRRWLENGLKALKQDNVCAVCGPGLTPPNDSVLAKVSGWVWKSWLGAGGAGTYRCGKEEKREVDDYPTFNLIVKKADFDKVKGFNCRFWPGEDTKLCHDLVYKLKKKIIYDPKVVVYHHRRPIFAPHLKQIAGYGIHRGYFARILPKTSARLGYFIPSLFVLGLLIGPFFYFVFKPLFWFYLMVVYVYQALLLSTALWVVLQSKSLLIGLLVMMAIFLSHIVYGFMFIKGLLIKRLKYVTTI